VIGRLGVVGVLEGVLEGVGEDLEENFGDFLNFYEEF
jgi:hypothetical protein